MTSLEIRRHNLKVLTDLQEGDLVEFNRKFLYSHWGVYVGNEEVVHLTGVGGISDLIGSEHVFTISGMTYNKAMVVKENFWKVAANSLAKRNNKDRERKPLNPNEIVEKALSMLGDIGYNLLWNNCEHFATFCRYDKKWSEQVENFFMIAGAVAGIGYGIYRHMKSKKEQDEKLKSICLFDQGESFVWF